MSSLKSQSHSELELSKPDSNLTSRESVGGNLSCDSESLDRSEKAPALHENVVAPKEKRILYISWAESCSRSDQTARELGGVSKMVYLGWLGSHPLTIGFKYLGQTIMTIWHLLRQWPDAVFVMSPPLFAALPALAWKWVFRRPFVLDCHTGAYTNPRWRRFQWLQHYLGRQAAANIVTNEHLKQLVEDHGGKAIIVRDVPVVYESTNEYPLPSGFNVAAVCSFNYDEPIAEMFEAAGKLVDQSFYFTGNPRHLSSDLLARKPENVTLTGFLSDDQYGSLLVNADVVLTLTTQDHTMLRGAWEAIYQGTPVIISNWTILRNAFDKGAVHTENTPEAIAEAILFAKNNQAELRRQAESAKQERIERWQDVKREFIEKLA